MFQYFTVSIISIHCFLKDNTKIHYYRGQFWRKPVSCLSNWMLETPIIASKEEDHSSRLQYLNLGRLQRHCTVQYNCIGSTVQCTPVNILQQFWSSPIQMAKIQQFSKKMGGKSSKLAIFNIILTLISYFSLNFCLNLYIIY